MGMGAGISSVGMTLLMRRISSPLPSPEAKVAHLPAPLPLQLVLRLLRPLLLLLLLLCPPPVVETAVGTMAGKVMVEASCNR